MGQQVDPALLEFALSSARTILFYAINPKIRATCRNHARVLLGWVAARLAIIL